MYDIFSKYRKYSMLANLKTFFSELEINVGDFFPEISSLVKNVYFVQTFEIKI